MERLFLECALRAALLVGGTAIVLYAMRVKPAAARHRVWTGVLALMLVLPIWTLWGPKLSLRVLPALPQSASETASRSAIVATTLTRSTTISTWDTVLLGIYLLGLCVLLIRLGTGTLRARRLAREAVVHDGVRTSRFCRAPVTVGFFRPVVILPEHWREWPRAQLDVILTHEGEHAMRHDSLVQWLALLNRAVFWFHPVAWWLERNLSALAEQACDDVVLGRGHNPRDYAEYLIDIARSTANSGARLNLAGMEMPGAALPKRIRRIMDGGQAPLISSSRMAYLVAACVITCAAFTGVTLARVQQDQSAKTKRPFDPLLILTPHEGVDFAPFSADLVRRVKLNWSVPAEAKQGTRGKVVVRFGIERDGALSPAPAVEVASGHKPLDDAAVSAIRASAPFEHLPEAFRGPKIELLLDFFYNMPASDAGSAAQTSTKFVLGDLKIEGDVNDRDGVRQRILDEFKGREYSDVKALVDTVMVVGLRGDLQNRGYFTAEASAVGSEPLGMADGKQRMLVTVSVNEGGQYRLGSLTVNTATPPVPLPPPAAVQDLIHLKRGDLFDVSEVRAGLARLKQWYAAHDPSEAQKITAVPAFHVDETHRTIDLTMTVSK